MDVSRAGGARRLRAHEGAHCGRLRRRSRRLEPGRELDRRSAASPAAAQTDAVCRAHAARRRACDFCARRERVGRWQPATVRARSTSMTASFIDLIDLASERLGGAGVAANDEVFAPKERVIKAEPAIWREGVYTERGKWMDGWETRRRRDDGDHDWCVVRLGARGILRGVDVDTSFFKGNYPESCAIDACEVPGLPTPDDLARAPWREVLQRSTLSGDSHNLINVDGEPRATHLRLRIFPDGGVARLRVYGEVAADWDRLRRQGDVDLAAAANGGVVVACSDMFFGSRHNLIMPGDATHMGDGWETRRRRGPGHDWTLIRLAA